MTTGATAADDATVRDRLRALRDEDERGGAEVRKACDAVDELLDVRQQGRFPLFEEQMERKKLDLLLRARQNAKAAAPAPEPCYNRSATRRRVLPSTLMQVHARPRFRVLAAAVALAVSASLAAQSAYTKQDAARFQTKLAQIVQQGTAHTAKAPRATQVTDAEVNAYLKYSAGSQVPVGVVDPQISALGNGRVGGRALVDLDAVRTQKKRGWTDPLGYLTGRLPITATGTLTTQNGIGKFQLESAELSGVTIPKTLLQELLSYYSKTPENPAGINMDDPFELPARIKEIKVGKGAATIVQ